MSALVTDAKALAKAAIAWLSGAVGQNLVADVWAVLVGSSEQEILEDLSGLVSGILSGARAVLSDEEIVAEIAAANLAVDATVDVLEAAELAASAALKPGA